LLLVAPLSAHTLAKISNGLCDDTLSCVLRAWDYGHGLRPGKPLLLAPAMNTAMWEHPLTQLQLQTIQGFWNTTNTTYRRQQISSSSSTYNDDENNNNNNNNNNNAVHIISPQVKTLACGEIGNGALASVDEILKVVCLSHAHKR
jgi:phosphopantothenoylcysteine synthetase/decarboxylase